MRFDDKMWLETVTVAEDARFNLVETRSYSLVGNCKMIPRGNATRLTSYDGKAYSYSDTVYARNPSLRPKEGDFVKLYNNTSKTYHVAEVNGVSVLPKKYMQVFVTITEEISGDTEGGGGNEE